MGEASESAHAKGKVSPRSSFYSAHSRIIVPQLLLGGNKSPAQDLDHIRKYSPNFLIAIPGRFSELFPLHRVLVRPATTEGVATSTGRGWWGRQNDRLGFQGRSPEDLRTTPKAETNSALFSARVTKAVGPDCGEGHKPERRGGPKNFF